MDELIIRYFTNMHTLLLLAIIVFFLFALGKGADLVVEQAVGMSYAWGLPKVIIGSTIVSLGTTLPEASVSVAAAIKGTAGLALGNAVGSIIVDTALILGLAVLLGKVPVGGVTAKRQSSLQLIAVVLLSLASILYLKSEGGPRIAQWMGFVFVGLLVLYILYSIKSGKEALSKEGDEEERLSENLSMFRRFVLLAIGIAIVIISSKALIPAVHIVALRVGIPEAVIGATLVAFGTSLPELITSVTAVRKGHGDLAIGNVIGADILNVLFVVGTSAMVTPRGLEVPEGFLSVQIPFMLISVFCLKLAIIKTKDHLSKYFAFLLLGLYLLYLILTFAV